MSRRVDAGLGNKRLLLQLLLRGCRAGEEAHPEDLCTFCWWLHAVASGQYTDSFMSR